ncbi:4'-phosphopantetheinyl transferase superfamily protein [Streptomyces sp. NPDC007851]|uniref:4'-phosphopantetheinyl transferase family protein n=1 Tax=Streptomyces sp. NPDC007851 TaxID=3155008 RepID=UPI003409DFD8
MNAVAHASLRDDGAVHVWHGRAPDALGPDDTALLSDEETRKARRLPATASLRYAAAHAAVRRVLAGHLGVPPRDLVLGRHPCPRCAHPRHGRPRIDWPPTDLEFSLSRSGPHWLLAVGAGQRLGVDLEGGRPLDVEGASRLVLSASELAHLRAAPDDTARRHAFFRCWTRKEAVVKAVGVGIATDLDGVDTRPADDPVLVTCAEGTGPGSWLVQDLPMPEGVFAALAREAGRAGPVVFRHHPGTTDSGADTAHTREVGVR